MVRQFQPNKSIHSNYSFLSFLNMLINFLRINKLTYILYAISGVIDDTNVALKDKLNDSTRISYHHQHLSHVLKAIK